MAKCKNCTSRPFGVIKVDNQGYCIECNKPVFKYKHIPVKPQPKLKRVKAWAYIFKDESISVCQNRGLAHTTPCTILIDEKYLKGKGEK